MKRFLTFLALICAFAVSVAHAQTAGTVAFTVSPASGAGSVTPSATWSTTPAAIGCAISGGAVSVTGLAPSGTRALPALTTTTDLTMTCSWSGGTGTWNFSWKQPSTYTDGSTIAAETNPRNKPVSYKVLYGGTATSLTSFLLVSDPAATSATIAGLSNGTWYAAVRAVTPVGVESSNSEVASNTINVAAVTATKTVTVNVDKIPSAPTLIVAATVSANGPPTYRIIQSVTLKSNEVVFTAPASMKSLFASR